MAKASDFIRVNGKRFPAPKRGLTLTVTTAVDSARNANNKVVGQKIGRDNYKLDNLEWSYLTVEEWSGMLKEFDKNFFSKVTFWDMVNNQWRTLTMYCGDRTANPMWVDPKTKKVTHYTDCKMNLIDAGW